MKFEFATAGRILFGAGSRHDAPKIAAGMGSRALIVTGKDPARQTALIESFRAAGLGIEVFSVAGEPKIETAQAGAEAARAAGCDLVIGIGGGGVIDAGKAISALAANPGDPLEYLEVIGKARPLPNPPLPYIAIPTTAGTGSEATRNAVLTSAAHQVKVSLRSPLMLPRLAVVDPELTYSLPPDMTASTGLDALTQVIEPLVCNRPNPITDVLCKDAIVRASWALRRAYNDGNDADAREAMALVSLYGGMSLANARLGAVHGFAAPLGGMFGAPHGAICAILLPHVMRANITALRSLPEGDPARREGIKRYTAVAMLLTGGQSDAEAGAAWVADLVRQTQIPALRTYGVTTGDFPVLVEKAKASSSMGGNPVKLSDEALTGILAQAL